MYDVPTFPSFSKSLANFGDEADRGEAKQLATVRALEQQVVTAPKLAIVKIALDDAVLKPSGMTLDILKKAKPLRVVAISSYQRFQEF